MNTLGLKFRDDIVRNRKKVSRGFSRMNTDQKKIRVHPRKPAAYFLIKSGV